MVVNSFFESQSNELGQVSFTALEGELFDFGGEFFDFEAACEDNSPASEEISEGVSPMLFENACFFDKDIETSFTSIESSGNSFEVDETFGAVAGDNVFTGNDMFAGLANDPLDLGKEFNFSQVSKDEFLWSSNDIAMTEPTTTTHPVTITRPTPSKLSKTLTREAKVTKKAATPKKTVTLKKAVSPKTAATQKKGLPAIASRERSLAELSNVPWNSLTQKERERLLLPMIRGTDPVTGANVTSPEASVTEPIVKSPGHDLKTGSVQTLTPALNTPTNFFSSPWEALTIGIHTLTNDQIVESLLEIAVIEGYHMSGDKTTTTPVLSSGSNSPNNGSKVNMAKNNSSIQSANTAAVVVNNNAAIQSFGPTNINTAAAGQGFASFSSTNNNIMAGVFKTPMLPVMYGITRQQEALKKRAQLQAQGRRR